MPQSPHRADVTTFGRVALGQWYTRTCSSRRARHADHPTPGGLLHHLLTLTSQRRLFSSALADRRRPLLLSEAGYPLLPGLSSRNGRSQFPRGGTGAPLPATDRSTAFQTAKVSIFSRSAPLFERKSAAPAFSPHHQRLSNAAFMPFKITHRPLKNQHLRFLKVTPARLSVPVFALARQQFRLHKPLFSRWPAIGLRSANQWSWRIKLIK